MSGADSRGALVPVRPTALAIKGLAALVKRGLGDLQSTENAETWFGRKQES